MKLNKHTRTAVQIAALALLVGGILGYGLQTLTEPIREVTVVAPAPTPRVVTGSSLAYPITIPAERARSYPGGYISPEQDLGIRDGYSLSKVSYPSDGYRIYALVATPASARPANGYPVIILAHGYTNPTAYRTDGPEYADYIAAFASHGYVVIKPDYRGYAQSWGTARGAYFSTDYTADVLNLATSLTRYPPVDASEMAIWGHSMGGHVALEAVTVAPKRFKAAVIASASVGTVDDMYYNWTPPSERANFDAQAEKKRVAALFGEPRQNPAFWAELSPLTYGTDLRTPLQLHHGLADSVVPARFSQEAADALTAKGANATLYTYPKAPHVFSGADEQLLIQRSLAWFDQYL